MIACDGPAFLAEPAPIRNAERWLEGAWRIRRVWILPPYRHTDGTLVPRWTSGEVVARFTTDGRDACERWGYGHRVPLLWRA